MNELPRSSIDKAIEVDLSGKKLGDYQMIRRLGRGGMAEVWLAEQESLRRQVALKLLRSELASDETYIQRFRIEAQAAARLIHGNIIQIYDIGCVDGIHYIAQEYVQGQNLREYLVRHGPPELKLGLSIIRQTASALQKAAEHNIVHRDIKPENIMLAKSGDVKVADFGLARVTGDGTLNLTQVGMTMGTPLYMSPEQVEGRALDSRSDVYSFGVTIYHMLAGTPPFRGETALSVAVQHLKTRPEPLEVLRPDLPAGLCRIVHKMLAKDPAQRYAKPRDILRDLRTLQQSDELDDAPEELAELSSMQELAPTGQSQATSRLAELMRTETMQLPKQRRHWLSWAWLILVGLGVGGLLGAATRARPLLATTAAPASSIPKQASARDQYHLAAELSTEEGWRSVGHYFPEDEYYVNRAAQQIARLYFYRRDYPEALKIFSELADSPDTDSEFRAFGLTGKCIVLAYQEKFRESSEILVQVWPLRDQLDPTMRRLLSDVLQENKKRLGQQEAEMLKDLRGEEFGRDD